MEIFLTSQIGASIRENGVLVPGKIDNSAGFLTQFKKCLNRRERMLYLSSTPDYNAKVQAWFENTVCALQAEGISFAESVFIKGENVGSLKERLPHTDVLFLSGGHLPTQNRFFQEIKLRNLLADFQGVIVAQSAGSMNCAETVYVCPEVPGESIDPDFERFRPGLGLTNIHIIPHYNANRDFVLDGRRFYEDIIYPDTFRIPLYVLSDGAYFYIHDGKAEAFGEMYLYHKGKFEKVFTPTLMEDESR